MSMVALRPALHGALLDAIGPDNIEVNREAVDFEASADGVAVRFAQGPEARGDVLIGADGVGSAIRKRLHPNEAPLRATAQDEKQEEQAGGPDEAHGYCCTTVRRPAHPGRYSPNARG